MSDEEIKKINRHNIKRRMKQSKMKRKIRHTQRKIKMFRIFLRIIMILGIIYLSYHIIYMKSWRLPSNAFSKIDSPYLKITNNKIIPSYKILAAIQRIEIPNKAIFLISTDDIRRSIMQIEPIQDVYIRRFWMPARVNIIIKERTPAIIVAPNEQSEGVAYFTKDGKLIGHEYMPLKAKFKTVKVLAYCSKDNDYRQWSKSHQSFIIKLNKLIETYASEKVQYIDFRNPDDVYIKLDTVLVRLGRVDEICMEEAAHRLAKLPSLLPQVKLLDKENILYLDLRWNNVYFIKLKKSDE